MLFDDWEKHKLNKSDISPTLLWEYNLDNFDWEDKKTIVVQRVIERGWRKDFYAAINLYGGLSNFIKIIKQVPYLNKRDMNYVSKEFDINLEDLKCYKRQLRREKLLNS